MSLAARGHHAYAARGGGDWNHTNSINYNAKLDQITISVRTFNELWVIAHSTTPEEAASHEGGERGRGGDLLYRWGNPAAYGRGVRRDMRLYGQHDVQWIEEGFPGEGNLLIFNNGGRDGREYSTVDEITTPFNKEAVYTIEKGEAFGPEKMHWSYGEKESERFSSSFISGAQRLANGNTLICSGADGRLFAVDGERRIVGVAAVEQRPFEELHAEHGAPTGGAESRGAVTQSQVAIRSHRR